MKNLLRSVSSFASTLAFYACAHTLDVGSSALLRSAAAQVVDEPSSAPSRSDAATGTSGEATAAAAPRSESEQQAPPSVPLGRGLAVAPVLPGQQIVFVPQVVPVASTPVDTTRRALNAVYFELGGNALIYSVNYERFLSQDLSARVGIGHLSVGGGVSSDAASLTTVPVMVNYLGVGRLDHRLELGAGLVVLYMTARTVDGIGSGFGSGILAAGTATVAYRYAPLDGGFNFKAGFTPLVSSFGIYPAFGVGAGAVF